MLIRLLTSQDAPAFQKLRLAALVNDPQAFLVDLETEQHRPLSRYASELQFASLTSPFGYYGMFEADNILIGYVQLGTTGLPKQKHVAFLYNLYVDPQFRGQGYAHALITYVKDLAQENGIEQLQLSCLARNRGAHDFYLKQGFKRSGIKRRSVKWQDQYDDEIELVCPLNSATISQPSLSQVASQTVDEKSK